MALSKKQALFALEYIKDLNATQAAIRAGYSEKCAKEIGYENLTKPHINEAIKKALDERADKVKVDAAYVLEKAISFLTANLDDFTVRDAQGVPRIDLSKATREQMACIESIQIDNGKVKITLPNKLKALEVLGKHIDVAAFVDLKVRHEGEITHVHESAEKAMDFDAIRNKRQQISTGGKENVH